MAWRFAVVALALLAAHPAAAAGGRLAVARRGARGQHALPRPLASRARAAARAAAPPPGADGGGSGDDDAARLASGAVSLAGVGLSGYLTAVKLSGSAAPAFCTAGSACSSVLSSPYASVGAVPLSALGCAAYATLGLAALAPLATRGAVGEAAQARLEGGSRALLQLGTAACAAFSLCLLALLALALHEPCPYCIGSATLCLVNGALVWNARLVRERAQAARIAACGAALSVSLAAALFAAAPPGADGGGAAPPSLVASAGAEDSGAEASAGPTLYLPPEIEQPSGARALALGKRLREAGARMYGAYWCSHCYEQKETLGRQAFSSLQYVECARDGADSRADECRARGVPGYPTWEIGGKLYPGEKDLGELERLLDDPSYAAEKAYTKPPPGAAKSTK